MGKFLVLFLLASIISCTETKLPPCTTNCGLTPVPPPTSGDSLLLGDNSCYVNGSPFGFGDGSGANPYRICSTAQFLNIGASSQAGKSFRQTVDLDFSGITFTPVGNGTTPFEGTYDGLQNDLADIIYSNSADTLPVGVFRILGVSSLIKNLNVLNVSMTGNERTGGLAGRASGRIQSVTLSGAITGNAHVGGLIGDQAASGLSVSGSEVVGTVISLGTSGSISNSAFGSRTALTGAGGVIGTSVFNMTLEDIQSTANVTYSLTGQGAATTIGAGGIVGATSGPDTIIDTVTTSGTILSKHDAGGVIGMDGSGNSETTGVVGNLSLAIYYRLSSTATVQGPNVVGGLVGYFNGGNLHQSFFDGVVNGKNSAGGVIGAGLAGKVTESFAAGGISELTNTSCSSVGGFIGKVYTSPGNFPFEISDSFSTNTIDLTCSVTSGVATFLGVAANSPNLLYRRVASFVDTTSFGMKAFGATGSNPAYFSNSVYYQNSDVFGEATGGIQAVTNPAVKAQYTMSLEFTVPLWRMTLINPFGSTVHPVPVWACELDGVTCI